MIGVILAAGVGSRLRPMTNDKPKCLVSVAGISILDYQLNAYRNAGIKEVYIIVGYEGSKIKEHCKYIKDLNIKIINNEQYEETNNMYSLFLVKEYVYGKDFILNNADLAIHDNIVKMMVESEINDLVAVDVGLFNDESMKVSVADNKISNISKNIPEENSVGCSIDFYKISAASSQILFDEVERIIVQEKNKKDWTEVALQRLFVDGRLCFDVLNVSGLPWVEIDNYDDLALADKIFSQLTKKIIDYKGFCFDLDGTVYVGNKVLTSVVDEINKLKEKGKIVRFISNNSSLSKKQYVDKLKNMGIDTTHEEIRISTDSVISFLENRQVRKVYVVGTKSLQKDIIDAGFEICSHEPEFVLLGYDTELTYSKLKTACRLINIGIDYICTHSDIFCPSENGPIPDIGAMVSMLELTTGKKPYQIFGKPNSDLLELIMKKDQINSKDLVMIGDRLYTDIKMAHNSGVDSVLVLSGDTKRDEVEFSSIKPTYILPQFSL
ncbi:HAD-IIA family hydrolase [Citrobacter freundii]|uniref:HAD-IIA family hydrolase n=1 Tax=Citrobacter freundii TaxID=546 RepID=UPI00292AA1AD|nr:HAD-IIA family hydrolase [Citrobacter freundii]MDV1855031.1 HAD-IIA family hydrolase [Citrobacter freundii]MEB0416225.1 HAD-IIA family hydrolase [Citrobacter freundii]